MRYKSSKSRTDSVYSTTTRLVDVISVSLSTFTSKTQLRRAVPASIFYEILPYVCTSPQHFVREFRALTLCVSASWSVPTCVQSLSHCFQHAFKANTWWSCGCSSICHQVSWIRHLYVHDGINNIWNTVFDPVCDVFASLVLKTRSSFRDKRAWLWTLITWLSEALKYCTVFTNVYPWTRYPSFNDKFHAWCRDLRFSSSETSVNDSLEHSDCHVLKGMYRLVLTAVKRDHLLHDVIPTNYVVDIMDITTFRAWRAK